MRFDPSQGGKDFSLPTIEIDSEPARRLALQVQERIRGYLGPEYEDKSLTDYIIMMLSQKTSKPILENSLIEVLGDEDAADIAKWLYTDLHYLLEVPLLGEDEEEVRFARDRSRSRSPVKDRRSNEDVDLREELRQQREQALPWRRPSEMDIEEQRRRVNAARAQSDRERHAYAAPDIPSFIVDFRQEREMRQKTADTSVGGKSLPILAPMYTPDELQQLEITVPPYSTGKKKGRLSRKQKHQLKIQQFQDALHAQREEDGHNYHNYALPPGSHPPEAIITVGGKPVDTLPATEGPIITLVNRRGPGTGRVIDAVFLGGDAESSEYDPKFANPRPDRSILVQGIPQNATNAIVRAHFSVCGPVPRVSILKKPVTGESSDLAWVTFKTAGAARRALQLDGSSLLLGKIRVWLKESEEARNAVKTMNEVSFDEASYDPMAAFRGMMGGSGGGYGYGGLGEEESGPRRFKYVRQEQGHQHHQQNAKQGPTATPQAMDAS